MTKNAEQGTDRASVDYVRRQIEQIEAGLQRALAGDFRAIRLDDADPLWGGFAMHVNVVINAARTAMTRAERFEREAAEVRRRSADAAGSPPVRALPRPAGGRVPRDFVLGPDEHERG
ncbi:MAG: hypothetical protein KDE27_07580 [Planctomycetes bacterium]|nr:hypothetical protein [Planctomycetota bacterium]